MKPGLIAKTKCLIVVLMLVLMNYSVSIAQTTYTHSPTSYPTSACSSGNFFSCNYTFTGSLLKLKGTTGSQLCLTMTKCTGSFGSSNYYIKWSDISSTPSVVACSNDYVQISPSGTPYTYTNSNPGFTSGTRYYILVVVNGPSHWYSNVVTVTASTLPTATTNAASLVTSNSARLNGSVNPNGANTAYAFEYGTTTLLLPIS